MSSFLFSLVLILPCVIRYNSNNNVGMVFDSGIVSEKGQAGYFAGIVESMFGMCFSREDVSS